MSIVHLYKNCRILCPVRARFDWSLILFAEISNAGLWAVMFDAGDVAVQGWDGEPCARDQGRADASLSSNACMACTTLAGRDPLVASDQAARSMHLSAVLELCQKQILEEAHPFLATATACLALKIARTRHLVLRLGRRRMRPSWIARPMAGSERTRQAKHCAIRI